MTSPEQLETDGLRMYNYAQQTLADINTAALTQLVILPSEQFVTSGQAVYDCEQVSVTVIALTTGLPGASVASIPSDMVCFPVWSIVMELAIVRCAPPMNAVGEVAPEAITAAFLQTSQDAGVLMGTINNILSVRFGNIIGSISSMASEGGLVATTARVTAALT